MKNFKFLLLSAVFLILVPSLKVEAKEKTYYEDDYKVVEYEYIGEIPAVLPECDIVRFPAYFQLQRGVELKIFVSKEHNSEIIISTPDLKGLGYYDLEVREDNHGKSHYYDTMMVTIEPLSGTLPYDLIADSDIFIWEGSRVYYDNGPYVADYGTTPIISIRFSDHGSPFIKASWMTMDIGLSAREYNADSKDDKTFKSSSAGMDNFAYFGWGSGGKEDVIFSTTEVYLPYDMLKDVDSYFESYYKYLDDKVELKKWYKTFKKYWKNKGYTEFDLDGYAKSLGYTASERKVDDDDGFNLDIGIDKFKVYRKNGYEISVSCGKEEGPLSGFNAMTYGSVYLDDKYVSTPTVHAYAMREEDFPAITVGDGYFISTNDLIIVLELLKQYN